MFKTQKYLKQLRDVQSRIKNCKEQLASLKMPAPSYKIGHELCDWFDYVACGGTTDLGVFERIVTRKLKVETVAYLEQLGNYFINIVEYERSNSIYNDELRQLQREECRLKDKLKIE